MIANGLGRESRAAKYDSPTYACSLRLNFMFLGDTAAGKSCLTKQFLKGRFDPTHKPTVAVDFHQSCVLVGRTQLWLNMWSMSEGENKNNHRDVNSTHFRGLDGVLIVCDVSQPSLLERIAYWLKVVDEKTAKQGYEAPVPVLIMVNKIDCLEESPEISLDCCQLDKFCKGGRASGWFATSAKTGMNVETCIKELVQISLSTPGPRTPPLAESISEKDLKSFSADIARLHTPLTTRNPPPRSKKNSSQINELEAAMINEPEPNEGHHHAERGDGCRCVVS